MAVSFQANYDKCMTDESGNLVVSFVVRGNEKYILRQSFKEMLSRLKAPNDGLKIEVDRARNRRSVNANAYLWTLLEKMAVVLHTDKDSLYIEMLERYGVFETVSIRDDALETAKRIFDYHKVLGESELNGKKFHHLRVMMGSHKYDTQQMARLIDGIVAECKELEIETATPDEIARMTSLWGKS